MLHWENAVCLAFKAEHLRSLSKMIYFRLQFWFKKNWKKRGKYKSSSGHHIIQKYQIYSLSKCNSKELYSL